MFKEVSHFYFPVRPSFEQNPGDPWWKKVFLSELSSVDRKTNTHLEHKVDQAFSPFVSCALRTRSLHHIWMTLDTCVLAESWSFLPGRGNTWSGPGNPTLRASPGCNFRLGNLLLMLTFMMFSFLKPEGKCRMEVHDYKFAAQQKILRQNLQLHTKILQNCHPLKGVLCCCLFSGSCLNTTNHRILCSSLAKLHLRLAMEFLQLCSQLLQSLPRGLWIRVAPSNATSVRKNTCIYSSDRIMSGIHTVLLAISRFKIMHKPVLILYTSKPSYLWKAYLLLFSRRVEM